MELVENKKKNIFLRHKGLFITLIIVLALLISYAALCIYNFVGRDYYDKGRIDYLNNLDGTTTNEKKNVVVILVDDMGYGDLSCTGSNAIKTPNIDNLASNGTLFENYYAPNPICSASRAGLLTGRLPIHTLTCGAYMDTETISGHLASQLQCILGTYPYMNTGLPTDEILLPEILQKVGYTTGLFGKWHLGVKDKEFPTNRGFDRFFGALYSDDMKPYRVYDDNKLLHKEPYNQTNLTKELTNECLSFIDKNKEDPFFLYYASPFPHWPATCSEEWVNTSKGGVYGDCMQEVDWSVGQILNKLNQEGLTDNTLVIFTSDNGPWYEGATGGDRGRKGTKYNGGSHVPLIVSMPNTLPKGNISKELTSGLDIFPTILSMIGVNQPTDRIIDGIDMWSCWKNSTISPRKQIFMNDDKDSFALIENNFKYIEKSASEIGRYWNLQAGPFLYNLETDKEEAYDVSRLYPEIAEQMSNEIKEFKKELSKNIRGWKK